MSSSKDPTNPSPVRIAVLLCDTPNPDVFAARGDYGEIFRTLFSKSVPSPDIEFEIDSFDVRNKLEYPEDIDRYAAVLITGSAASAYEDVEWINKLVEYVRDLTREKPAVRLIGICFGHQIIARALGGECVPNDGKWEVGVTKIDLTELGKKLFGVSELNIEEMHRDHVPAVPPSFHLLGSSPIAPNQGMVQLYPSSSTDPAPDAVCAADVHIFTVQGHPEFDEEITSKITAVRHAAGVMSDALIEDFKQRTAWRNDGVGVVGKTIWEVVLAARTGA